MEFCGCSVNFAFAMNNHLSKSVRNILFIITIALGSVTSWAAPLKVLAIGNSFSVDAVEQDLHAICSTAGKEILIGSLYIGGCSLEQHLKNLEQSESAYLYTRISPEGEIRKRGNTTLKYALLEEDWDYITFQQASDVSGIYESYVCLPELISRVREIVGERPRFLWHMTWAYAPHSTHPGFDNYGRSQKVMFDSIVACAERVMSDNPDLHGIIPVGMAIQDARESGLGTNLTRDGYHLSLTVGRYIASATWFKVLFNGNILANPFMPQGVSLDERAIARAAVATAVEHPFKKYKVSIVRHITRRTVRYKVRK